MAEPIILDGGAQKITITLPSPFTQVSPGVFTVEPSQGEPLFDSIDVKDENDVTRFHQPRLTTRWKITINRAK